MNDPFAAIASPLNSKDFNSPRGCNMGDLGASSSNCRDLINSHDNLGETSQKFHRHVNLGGTGASSQLGHVRYLVHQISALQFNIINPIRFLNMYNCYTAQV